MIFTVDGVRHEFDSDKMTFAEGRALERVTGEPFGELGNAAAAGNLSVIQAFVWVAMKRVEPTLQFSDLDDRAIGDIDFEDDETDEKEDPTGGAGEGDPSTTSS